MSCRLETVNDCGRGRQQMVEPVLSRDHRIAYLPAGAHVAPGSDNFDGIAVFVAEQVQLVAYPAIGIVFSAKSVFVDEVTDFEEARQIILHAGGILGMNAARHEVAGRRYSSGS